MIPTSIYDAATSECLSLVLAMKISQKTDHHSKRNPPGASIAVNIVKNICQVNRIIKHKNLVSIAAKILFGIRKYVFQENRTASGLENRQLLYPQRENEKAFTLHLLTHVEHLKFPYCEIR